MKQSEKALSSAKATVAGAPNGSRSGIRALFGLDRWSTSTECAELLAPLLPPGSKVRMLTVVSYQAQSDSPWNRLGDPEDAAAQIASTQSEVFAGARRILEMAGAQVSATHRFGDPADEILNEASDWGADLILLGHHNGLVRWFLGSVTESIVKRADVPVLVVPKLKLSYARASAAQLPSEVRLRERVLA